MIRGLTTTIVCACLAGAIGVGLYFIKHEVKEQEARLAELNEEIQSNQEAMHVLKAEWSYLNDPARLRALSEKHLAMKVMGPNQVATLETMPVGTPVYLARAAAANARSEAAQAALPPGAIPAVATAAVVTAKPAPARPETARTDTTRMGKPAVSAPPPRLAVARPAAPPAAPKAPEPKAAASDNRLATLTNAARAAAAAQPARPAVEPAHRLTPPPAAMAAQAPRALAVPPAPNRSQPQQPGRSIVIQSPALAATPAPFGEVR